VTRSDLARTLAPVASIPREEIPDALGELRRLDAILQARLLVPEPPDRLLTADAASRLLGVGAATLYRRADDYSFTVRHGKSVRFSERGIQDWLAAHREPR
jgi:predicted DNA-binding transcriptional regulator AlpA